jgi:hypothetical protein
MQEALFLLCSSVLAALKRMDKKNPRHSVLLSDFWDKLGPWNELSLTKTQIVCHSSANRQSISRTGDNEWRKM